MSNRFCFGALMLVGLTGLLSGCSTTSSPDSLTTIVISPSGSSAVTVTLAPQGIAQGHAQFTAIGYYGHAGHQITKDITQEVTWSSSLTQVAVICTNGSPSPCTTATDGLATATGFTSNGAWTGFTQITASAPGFNGTIVSNSATFTVTSCSSCVSTDITSISVIPATQAVATLNVPIQFEAIGTAADGSTEVLTSKAGIQWNSSSSSVASIVANTGLATTTGAGTTTVTAIFINPDGTASEGSAVLTVAPTTVAGSAEPLTSMTVSPNAQTASSVGQSLQFLAIATTGTGTTVNLTNQGTTINSQAIKAATWTSSNQSVVIIDPATGIATTKGSGAAVITAIATNPDGSVVIGQSNLTVSGSTTTSAEPLASLTVLPATQTSLAVGQQINFLALGTTGSGGSVNLTSQPVTINGTTINPVVWSSSNPSVASIDPATGIATSKGSGATAITAIATNPDKTVVTASAVLTVTVTTAEPLVSLAIVPAAQTLTATNQTASLIAIGTTASGATVNLTGVPATIGTATIQPAQWKSSVTTVASVDLNSGIAKAGSVNGTTAITATVVNPDLTVVTATATITVNIASTPEPLVSLAIVPSAQTLTATGQTANLIAIGTTASGATVNLTDVPATIGTATIQPAQWKSSVSTVASVDAKSGIATAGTVNGTTAIIATAVNPADGTVVTATATITVNISATPEPLLSMSIVPDSQSAAAGQPVQLLAIGTFSSSAPASIGPGQQNMANVSSYTVKWYSSNPSVAAICSQGLPAATCTGVPDGVVTGVSTGSTAITAIATGNPDKSAVTATATFTVSGPSASTISGLSIYPASQTITMPEVGQPNPTVNLVVIGTNAAGLQTNVTSGVTWTSSNPAVIATAGCPPATSGTCDIASGPSTAVVTAIGPGSTTITATYKNLPVGGVVSVVTQTATLTVSGPASEPLLSLAILPNSPSVQFPGQNAQLTAVGTFSAIPFTQDLTAGVTWSSSNPLIATVCNSVAIATIQSNCPTTPGLVTGVSKGAVAITATATNPDGSFVYTTTSFTVQAGSQEQISALTIVPGSLSLSATGQPGYLVALGTSTLTGLEEDMTNSPQLTWTSSNPTIATVCTVAVGTTPANCPATPGLVAGVSAGSTNVTAEFYNQLATGTTPAIVQSATVPITVTSTPAAEPLLSITVLPTATTIDDLLGTGQYLAYGTFSTAPTQLDITNGFYHAGFPNAGCTAAYAAADAAAAEADAAANLPVTNLPYPTQCSFVPTTWTTTAPYIFPINSAGAVGATGGLVTADGSGTDDIYVVASNPDSTLVYSPIVTFNCPYVAPSYGTKTVVDANGVATTTTDFTALLNPGSCNALTIGDSLLSTLTIFNTGVNTSDWLILADSATGTKNVIHCGGSTEQATSQGSVCTAAYPNGTSIVLTAPAEPATATEPAVKFGGWSSDCTPCTLNPDGSCTAITTAPFYSEAGPNYCSVVLGGGCTYNQHTGTQVCTDSSNVSVGAIFN